MIDIVIPTMWMCKDFDKALNVYAEHPQVNKIIIIDNCSKSRPDYEVLNHSKIELVSYGRNIYVNPAWNEGYAKSSSKILAIINDDISVSHDIFDMVIKFNLKPGDLIGVNLRGYQDNYKIDDHIETKEEIVKLNYNEKNPIGGQAWAFGICMFMLRESYTTIPQLYQIWYGDDYLAQHASAVYAINSNKIKGKISETLKKFNDPDDEISKRIELDSKNLLRFNHFKNAKNWDIPKNMIAMYESQRLQKTKPAVSKKSTFELEYEWAIKNPSDINENVNVLYELAKECNTVVEMGVRTGVSTRAFLNTNVKLISFDIVLDYKVQQLFDYAKKQNKDVQYIKDNVLNIEIDECDLLFIDTLHTYDQLKQELKLHGNKAKKYIAFHDTHTFGLRDEVGNGRKGLMTAIIEFMSTNPHWVFHIHKTNNNGLTVLKRV
jgi:hypothetical protein